MHGVQPLFNKYCTCLEISASESGGKKEKVSNILRDDVKTKRNRSVQRISRVFYARPTVTSLVDRVRPEYETPSRAEHPALEGRSTADRPIDDNRTE